VEASPAVGILEVAEHRRHELHFGHKVVEKGTNVQVGNHGLHVEISNADSLGREDLPSLLDWLSLACRNLPLSPLHFKQGRGRNDEDVVLFGTCLRKTYQCRRQSTGEVAVQYVRVQNDAHRGSLTYQLHGTGTSHRTRASTHPHGRSLERGVVGRASPSAYEGAGRVGVLHELTWQVGRKVYHRDLPAIIAGVEELLVVLARVRTPAGDADASVGSRAGDQRAKGVGLTPPPGCRCASYTCWFLWQTASNMWPKGSSQKVAK
jgi:hypothetical protein